MAKKKRKTKKRASEESPGLRPWAMPAAWAEHPHFARTAAMTLGVVLLVVGVCLGMGRLETRVHQLPRYEHSLALEWQDLPDWLQLSENRHILHTLTRKLDLLPTDHLLDTGLAARLGAALADENIGWIDSVERIMVRPDGVVSVRCRFRRPAAWVRRKGACYLVDAGGIRLPGRYQPADCVNSALMTIAGVRRRPPAVGHLWEGADLESGLTMAGMISKHPFRRQVDLIIVANHNGRVDRDRPYIELATDRPGSRIWWGRPPNQEDGTEISAPQKLALLDSLYRRWHRIDLNRAYVDVRTHPNSVVLPAAGR